MWSLAILASLAMSVFVFLILLVILFDDEPD